MFIISIVLLATAIYLYLRHVYSYWSRHGFPYLKPSIPAGNLNRLAKREQCFGENLFELYKQSAEPFVGIYMLFKPALLVRDAELTHQMLTVDFASFHDRGVYCNPKYDPLSDNIFAMNGNRWKSMRAKLSPAFTTGKLKAMLPTLMTEGDRLTNYLEKFADQKDVVEVKDLMSRYSMNVIGSVIFGLDVDTITNPDDSFRSIDKLINNPSVINTLKLASIFLCPKLLEFFNVNAMSHEVQEYMINIVKQQIEFREQNHVSRKDFIQILIQLRNNSELNDDDSWDVQNSLDTIKSLTIEQCAAQVFLFYVAGFDTTATMLSYTLYELARNPEVQRRLREDIDNTLKKYDGHITYESVMDMKYVDLCLMETIRKYPALPILNRECTIDYTIPGTKHTIKKGTAVIFSVLGISRDPVYFPEPETYRPERFADAVPEYNVNAFIPFGVGPRACIGLRLGKMSGQIALAKLMQKYSFEIVDHKPLEFDNFSVSLQAKGGIGLRVTHRQNL